MEHGFKFPGLLVLLAPSLTYSSYPGGLNNSFVTVPGHLNLGFIFSCDSAVLFMIKHFLDAFRHCKKIVQMFCFRKVTNSSSKTISYFFERISKNTMSPPEWAGTTGVIDWEFWELNSKYLEGSSLGMAGGHHYLEILPITLSGAEYA